MLKRLFIPQIDYNPRCSGLALEANMGGGGPLQPKAWREANVNQLTDPENRDPISGFPVFKALLCEVVKD